MAESPAIVDFPDPEPTNAMVEPAELQRYVMNHFLAFFS
jgi:hypothetical protein